MLGHRSATLSPDLFGYRLDVVADGMELARAAAVSRDAGAGAGRQSRGTPNGLAELEFD